MHPVAGFARGTTAIGLAVFLLCYLGLLIGIDVPGQPYFDETHYVPAARQLLETGFSIPTRNLEHPPLAKELIALSIWLFGDNPFGWRTFSALFGGLAVTGIYLCGLAVFDSRRAAVWTASIAALNQMLFVQARVAMLDIFSLAFVVWGLAFFFMSFRENVRTRRLLYATGLCLGLATACKWNGILAWGLCMATFMVVLTMRQWQTVFVESRNTDWYRPDLWTDVRSIDWVLALGLIPLASYFATFLPIYGIAPGALVEAQRRIFQDNAHLSTPHPYMSSWPSWPLLLRPMWFLFEKIAPDSYLGVASLGNPVICWSAIPALLVCLHDWIVSRRRDAFLIVASYSALYFSWIAVPRAVGFSYYYLPAITVASLALTYCLFRGGSKLFVWSRWIFLAAAFACFVLFLPITSASVGISIATYERLMWLNSWP